MGSGSHFLKYLHYRCVNVILFVESSVYFKLLRIFITSKDPTTILEPISSFDSFFRFGSCWQPYVVLHSLSFRMPQEVEEVASDCRNGGPNERPNRLQGSWWMWKSTSTCEPDRDNLSGHDWCILGWVWSSEVYT